MASVKKFPNDRQIVLIEDPIYTEYDLSDISEEDFGKFVLKESAVDAYCSKCEQMSVFLVQGVESYKYQEKLKEIPKFGIITINAKCARDGDGIFGKCSSELICCFNITYKHFVKIGQFPSKASLDIGGLDPVFNKELDRELRKELGKAIGLKAHGIGIGSFVYLRRIFERLIEEGYSKAQKIDDWSAEKEASYKDARTTHDRIKILSDFLPNRLVTKHSLYGILSKGIHELSEEECLSHFDLVQQAILMILNERHEEKKNEAIEKELNKASMQLNQSKLE